MKPTFTLKLLLAILLLNCTMQVDAQDPAGISFKRLFLDYQTLQGGDFGAFKDYRGGFEIGLHLPISKSLLLNVPVKIGLGNRTDEVVNQHIIGMDAQLHYYFLQHTDQFSPYILAGVGAVYQGKDSFNLQVPAGIGVDIRIAPNAYFNLQSEFRWSSVENNNNFHHGIGFKYFFGQRMVDTLPDLSIASVDTDGDGIPDEFDECPLEPGLAAFAGCPDRDGDGIPDHRDECPDTAGLMELMGCPDRDGDGIPDHKDRCPDVAGPASNDGCPVEELLDTDGDGIPDVSDLCPEQPGPLQFNGCPDTDGDGIPDHLDRCPDVAGLKIFDGCPDTDGDGIEDSKDKCPNTPGPLSNDGCPVIEAKDREVLSFAMKAVQFELGKATLKSESHPVLNQIADIMRRYPDYKLSIEGHTDNIGTADVNQKLSVARARACYEYLIQRGIPASRMTFKGFGQSRPIADNSTFSGRTLNRRVEFNLAPGN